MRPILVFLAGLLVAGPVTAEPSDLEHLKVFLTGTFANTEQARNDQNFRRHVLNLAAIWTNRADGPWLYAEQALADAPAHPHRQLVYQIVARDDGALELRIFDLPDPIGATGAWKDPDRLANLSPAMLTARQDCFLLLRQSNGSFKGGTEGKGCSSDLRGASYRTCEMAVTNVQIVSWERGYNAAGIQVWGSIHGGYVFKRVD